MIQCPSCNAKLSSSDFETGKCPQCGLTLRGGTVVGDPVVASNQTIDMGERKLSTIIFPNAAEPEEAIDAGLHSRKTIDMGSDQDVTTGVPSSESKGNKTVEIHPIQKTVDSDLVDFRELRPPASSTNVTVDLGALPPERDTDAVEIDPITVAGGIRSSAADAQTTIDLSRLSPDSVADLSASRLTKPPVRNAENVTVDLSRMSPGSDTDSIDMGSIRSAKGDLGATIDASSFVKSPNSVDSASAPRTEGGTVFDREINQTVDSIVFGAPLAKPGTVDDDGTNATAKSIHLDQPPQKPGTVLERELMKTYDSMEVSSRDAKQMDQMWRGANVEKASPRMTIKGREEQKQTTRSSLVIQPRNFRETKTPELRVGGDADYDLIKMLGQGGMGVVYWARQASIDRNVAIKMLKPDMAKDAAQRNKFLAEAVITGDLDHPNIVPIYDLGKNPEGALFYAMKKVQGTPWDRAISHKTLSENLDILMKVADAVAFAHNRFVVHRDLKPENVMLGDFGEVLVMDWGLALPFGRFEKSRSIQPSVSMGGTPAYMAPEMATGPFDKIGPTSDVYLLGAILFEIVTGKPPHTGKDVMKCLFAAAKNEIQPTQKGGELLDIALKAMSTKQLERFQTVQEFQQSIREYESHSASITMTVRAGETLVSAQKADSYQQFATAVFEYQEALKLWGDNAKARAGVPAAKLGYAQSALRKGDLDLAESLLDLSEPSHADCQLQIEAAKQEREAKQQRLKAARRAVRGLAAAVFVAVTTGLVAVGYQTIQVSKQRDRALVNQKEAEKQQRLAKANEVEAVANFEEAERQKTKAVENAEEAKKQATLAKANADRAEENAKEAHLQKTQAVKNADEAELQKTKALASADEAKRQNSVIGSGAG